MVDALLEVLGPHGTLAVPTFPFTGSMLAHVRADPDFDVDETPSKTGAIAEEVRTRPGALRSLEPTHPVAALGPLAEFLAEDHVNAEGPCDAHSPLYRLTQVVPTGGAGGWVLLLGVDFRSCTLLHTTEELARARPSSTSRRATACGGAHGGARTLCPSTATRRHCAPTFRRSSRSCSGALDWRSAEWGAPRAGWPARATFSRSRWTASRRIRTFCACVRRLPGPRRRPRRPLRCHRSPTHDRERGLEAQVANVAAVRGERTASVPGEWVVMSCSFFSQACGRPSPEARCARIPRCPRPRAPRPIHRTVDREKQERSAQ